TALFIHTLTRPFDATTVAVRAHATREAMIVAALAGAVAAAVGAGLSVAGERGASRLDVVQVSGRKRRGRRLAAARKPRQQPVRLLARLARPREGASDRRRRRRQIRRGLPAAPPVGRGAAVPAQPRDELAGGDRGDRHRAVRVLRRRARPRPVPGPAAGAGRGRAGRGSGDVGVLLAAPRLGDWLWEFPALGGVALVLVGLAVAPPPAAVPAGGARSTRRLAGAVAVGLAALSFAP